MFFCAFLCTSHGICGEITEGQAKSRSAEKAFVISTLTLIGANVFDVLSSRGAYEANPYLRNTEGGFSVARGVVIKSSATGGLILLQWILRKKMPHERLTKPFTAVNFFCAGVVGATAIRNYHVAPLKTPSAEP